MIESTKPFIGKAASANDERVPSSIKSHTQGRDVRVVPDENRSHRGDVDAPKIIPGERQPDINLASMQTTIPFDSASDIKIAPKNEKPADIYGTNKAVPDYIKTHDVGEVDVVTDIPNRPQKNR